MSGTEHETQADYTWSDFDPRNLTLSRRKTELSLRSLAFWKGFTTWYSEQSKALAPRYRTEYYHTELVKRWLEDHSISKDKFASLYRPRKLKKGLRRNNGLPKRSTFLKFVEEIVSSNLPGELQERLIREKASQDDKD